MTFDDLPSDLRALLFAAGLTTIPLDDELRKGLLGALRKSHPTAWEALAVHVLRAAGSVASAAPALGLSAPRLWAVRRASPALLAIPVRGAGAPVQHGNRRRKPSEKTATKRPAKRRIKKK